MMYGMLGEFISTFFLILIGVGGCIFVSDITRLKVAFIWGMAVFIGTIAGNFFGSAKMNIVFLFVDLLDKESTTSMFFVKLFGEVFGATIATLILLVITKNRENKLSNFAAIASINDKTAFLIEMFATFSMIMMSTFFGQLSNKIISSLLMSGYIGLLIFILAPVTGASFNPIRDFIPRSVYSLYNKDWGSFKDSILSSNVAPIVSGIIWITFFYNN